MSWTDQRCRGAQVPVARHLASSQPKCAAEAYLYGHDADKPRSDPVVPKGKKTTITLGRLARSIDVPSAAQTRAVEFSERGHKLQRLDARADEYEQRSPQRCQQTSITSIAHRDLARGGIEAVLRRGVASPAAAAAAAAGGTASVPPTSARRGGTGADAPSYGDDDVPSLEQLADEGWARPRIDPDALRDPYLRKEGLHVCDAGVYSHIAKRLVSSRSLTRAIVDKSVDFNFQFSKKR
jgi:hypothetical protein